MRKPGITIRGHRISFSAQVFLWPVLVFAALLFAQSLKMAVSYMVFIFVLLMPIGTILQLLAALLFIRTSVRTETDTVEKLSPTGFSAIVSNDCILPFPLVEAELLLPDERGISCAGKTFTLSIAPLSGCVIDRSVSFSFRGEYRVGIRSVTVCDCFHAVMLRIPCEKYTELFVLPRRFELPPRPHSAESELDTQRVMRAKGSDNTELSDIRTYLSGDSLKSIHWKLSSKSEELIVKDYSRNKGNSVCILCDLEPHFANAGETGTILRPLPEYAEIIDMLATDLVIETCIASVLRELRAGNDVTLMWMRDGYPREALLTSIADFDRIYRQFAFAPLDTTGKHISKLAAACTDIENSSLIFVSAHMDPAIAAEYQALTLLYGGTSKPPELLCCTDKSLFASDPDAEKQYRDCIYELESCGITVEMIRRRQTSVRTS
ncbi:MAG: DUF58 domain-containing protein [Ruminococcaceae bacterium]|nr:DUF58 domain-containing protein [Oscillospiraceae bacterium]